MASRSTGDLVFLLALLLSCVAMSSAARNLQEVEASDPPKEEEPSSAGSMPFPHLTVPELPPMPELPVPELPPLLQNFKMPLFPEMHLPSFPGMPWKPAVHMPTIPGFNFPDPTAKP
jgi:hypothetical protein